MQDARRLQAGLRRPELVEAMSEEADSSGAGPGGFAELGAVLGRVEPALENAMGVRAYVAALAGTLNGVKSRC